MGFSWSSLLPVVGAVAGGALGSTVGMTGLGASLGGSLGGAAASSSAKATQSKAEAENWDKYAAMMKLSPEEEQALIATGKQRLSQNMLASRKNLSNVLAGKNLGGGMLASGLADTTRAYDTAVGDLTAKVLLADQGKVPSTLPPVQLGSGTYFTGELGNIAEQLGGMGTINAMFETDAEKKRRLAAAGSPASSNWLSNLFNKKPDYSYLQSEPAWDTSLEW